MHIASSFVCFFPVLVCLHGSIAAGVTSVTGAISSVVENNYIHKLEHFFFLGTEPQVLQNVRHLYLIMLLCVLNVRLLLHVEPFALA